MKLEHLLNSLELIQEQLLQNNECNSTLHITINSKSFTDSKHYKYQINFLGTLTCKYRVIIIIIGEHLLIMLRPDFKTK